MSFFFMLLSICIRLHFSVGYPPIVRIDGTLMEVSDKVITAEEAESLYFHTI
jgi:Tfp pilus assembly ATPase PilU